MGVVRQVGGRLRVIILCLVGNVGRTDGRTGWLLNYFANKYHMKGAMDQRQVEMLNGN